MDTPIAILLAGVLIAGSILFAFHWEIVGDARITGNGNPATVRLDRWTGTAAMCVYRQDLTLDCAMAPSPPRN